MKMRHSQDDFRMNFLMVGISLGTMFYSLLILAIKLRETLCLGFEMAQLILLRYLKGVKRNKWVQMSPKS